MSEKIKVKDQVVVHFDSKSNDPASKYSGQVMTVKSKRAVDTRSGDMMIYTLEGTVADSGIPYSFISNNLTRV